MEQHLVDRRFLLLLRHDDIVLRGLRPFGCCNGRATTNDTALARLHFIVDDQRAAEVARGHEVASRRHTLLTLLIGQVPRDLVCRKFELIIITTRKVINRCTVHRYQPIRVVKRGQLQVLRRARLVVKHDLRQNDLVLSILLS